MINCTLYTLNLNTGCHHQLFLCLQVEPLCEFPSHEFYNGQLKTSSTLKCYNYSGLNLFWPKGTAYSMYLEHGVHVGLG